MSDADLGEESVALHLQRDARERLSSGEGGDQRPVASGMVGSSWEGESATTYPETLLAVKKENPDDGVGDGSSKKKKKTRNRKPSSCVPCRKRKLRCNRAAPCDQCTLRGDADNCEWDGAVPLFNVRNENDAEELRQQVARLEGLVRYLTSRPGDHSLVPEHLLGTPIDPPLADQRSATSTTTTSSPAGLASDFSPPLQSPVHFPSEEHHDTAKADAIDLRANDLCEALSQLAIQEFVHVEGSGNDSWAPGGRRGEEFVLEAREFMEMLPQRFGLSSAVPAFHTDSSSHATTFRAAFGDPSHISPAGDSDHGSSTSALSPGNLGSTAFHRSPPPISDVLRFLPTPAEAISAYKYFCGYVSWYSHPVHLVNFEQQWEQLRLALLLAPEERAKAIDPFFVATFLGILSMGLAMMPVKRALRDGFPADKDKVVDFWLEGAMMALTCGRFLDNPSVEAVRAVVVISTYFVFMGPGESSGAGMGLLALSVQVAMSLGLHRDPDRTPSRFSFCEAEERRRLFWSLFMLCILSSSSLGRTWAVFDLKGVDTKLPLDCHDHEIVDEATAHAGAEARRRKGEETPMTSLLCKMRLAVMAKKINDRAFGIHPVSYDVVLALDRELKEFEESIPTHYQLRLDSLGALIRPSAHVTVTEMRACMIQISLASEFIRLHRPWLVLAAGNSEYQYSRDQAIKYCKLLLAVYRSPSCVKQRWGGLNYKATNAAIVLAVEILAFPTGSEATALRAVVRSTAAQMETHSMRSSVCRKGSRIIRFLLEKDQMMIAQRDERREAKRARVVEGSASLPSRLASAFDTNFASHSPQLSHRLVGFSNEQEPLRRKYCGFPSSTTSLHPFYNPPPLILTSASYPRQMAPIPLRPSPPQPSPTTVLREFDTANFPGIDANFAFDFKIPIIAAPNPRISNPYAPPLFSAYDLPQPPFPGPTGLSSQYYQLADDRSSRSSDIPPL